MYLLYVGKCVLPLYLNDGLSGYKSLESYFLSLKIFWVLFFYLVVSDLSVL